MGHSGAYLARTTALAVSFVLFAQSVQSLDAVTKGAEAFPGYLGGSVTAAPNETNGTRIIGIDSSKIIQLSAWKPRAYLYKGFLSEAECDHIINKATPRLERSSVTNNDDGSSELSEIRTSSGTFMDKAEDNILKGIEERISEWTFLPIANQESLQVLRYTKGQKYEPHVDYFHDPVNKQRGGHRYATVLMYLNDVELGGETVFPTAKDDKPKDDTWSDCAKGFLAVKPHKGDALLFFSMHPDGTPDDTSLHYACPVVKGEKWSAPMWIHVADFNQVYQYPKDGGAADATSEDGRACTDTNAHCDYWAKQGECKNNTEYMMEACRKACRAC